MRPNLAFGPIDSVMQYLLYLSVVVLGVLLPVLVQKWRTRREKAKLLQRSLVALHAEIEGNHKRLLVARDSFANATTLLAANVAQLKSLRERLVADSSQQATAPAEQNLNISLGLTAATAWDVARLADALVLIPAEQLTALTRAYQLQRLYETDRAMLLQTLMKSAALDLPADLRQLSVLDARLEGFTVAHAVLQYQTGMAQGLIDAYAAALATFANNSQRPSARVATA
jgi:hypothetical protein